MIELLRSIFGEDKPIADFAVFVSIIAIAVILYFLIFFFLKKLAQKSSFSILDTALNKLKQPVFFLLLLFAVAVALPVFTIGEEALAIIRHIMSLMMITAVAWLLIRSAAVARKTILNHYDIEAKDNLKARKVYTQFRVLERIVISIIIVVAVAAGLMTFETIRQVGVSMLASAGIAGVIIGLAAQKMIGTMLAGFQIAITQPIRLEDVVIVEGEFGYIEEITLTYVVVRLWDKRRLVVPTTYFIEKPFQNWTRISSDLLATVYLYADYRLPVDELRQEFERILNDTPLWDKQAKALQVTDVKNDMVEIRLLFSAPNAGAAWELRVHVREQMIAFLQEHYPDSLPVTRVLLEQEGIR